jgi:hypothetical protein
MEEVGNNRQLLTILLVIYFMGRGRERQAIANGSYLLLFYLLFILWEGIGNNKQLLTVLLVIYFMGRGREHQSIAICSICYLFYGKGQGTTGDL